MKGLLWVLALFALAVGIALVLGLPMPHFTPRK